MLAVLAEAASDDLQQYLADVRYQRDAPVVAALYPILIFMEQYHDDIFPLLRHLAPLEMYYGGIIKLLFTRTLIFFVVVVVRCIHRATVLSHRTGSSVQQQQFFEFKKPHLFIMFSLYITAKKRR